MDELLSVEDLLKLSVDKASVQLGRYSRDQLTAIREAEAAGADRTSMIDAIDRELKARDAAPPADADDDDEENVDASAGLAALDAGARELGVEPDDGETIVDAVLRRLSGLTDDDDDGVDNDDETDFEGSAGFAALDAGARELGVEPEDGETFVDAILRRLSELNSDNDGAQNRIAELESLMAEDAGADVSDGPAYTQIQVDKLLADQRRAMEVESDRRVEQAVSAATTKPLSAKKAARPMSIVGSPTSLGELVQSGASQVVLIDEDDVPLAELPPVAFEHRAYQHGGGRVILNRDIEVPEGIKERHVAGAFVLVDGKPVGKATLVMPFSVGGGRSTSLPPGTFSFEGGDPATPEEALAG